MNEKYKKLFESFTLPASGIELKNRIVIAPMTTWSGNGDGTVSDDEISYYSERAGGAGAFITACAYVAPDGKGFAGQIGVHSDEMIPGLSRIAETIKKKGARAILQIYHGGRMSPPNLLPGGEPLSASAVPAVQQGAPVPREMTGDEILRTIDAFGEAARRAVSAGFDGVEIHGANTYLLQQFFSPHSNRRTDRWGGDTAKRMTFPLAVVERVIDVVKNNAESPFAVGYRLSPEETENPGITIEDTLLLAVALSSVKIDYLHISTMDFNAGSLRDINDRTPRALLIQEKTGRSFPVIGVGNIHTPDDALRLMDSGIPLVAMGREFLMEPHWVEKVISGRENEIRTTLRSGSQKELVIPEKLWHGISTRKGWLPFAE